MSNICSKIVYTFFIDFSGVTAYTTIPLTYERFKKEAKGMYDKHEPSALFHGLHHAHKRRVAEEQAARGVGELGAPMLLMSLFYAETVGEQWSQRDVARTLRLSPATVAVSLKTLERDGYVERSADERDQRRNRVALTHKGRAAVELCGASFRAVDERMLAGFTAREREELTGFFKRMIDNLGGVEPPPFCPSEKERERGW